MLKPKLCRLSFVMGKKSGVRNDSIFISIVKNVFIAV